MYSSNIIHVYSYMQALFLFDDDNNDNNKSAKGSSKWRSPEWQSICTTMIVRYEFVSGIRTLI